MANKKLSTSPKRTVKKTAPVEEITDVDTQSSPSASTTPTGPSLSQIAQQLNMILILGVALFLFNLFLFWKIKNIEKTGGTAQAAGQAKAQGGQQSPAGIALSDENLKKYAKDLQLDTKKFDQCLTSDAKKDAVAADAALGAKVGVQGTPGFFINGRFLDGAFPYENFKEIIDKELDGTATGNCADYSEQLQAYCKDPATAAFKPEPQEMEIGNSPVKGKADARVTIVEFSDFECPFCARAFPIVQQIMKEYPNDVKVVYKHLPLSDIHPRAQKAAEASACAQEQEKFWEYHDKIFQSVQG